MSMSPHLGDREQEKFVETEDGETAVRVQSVIADDDGDEVDVNSDGSINVKEMDVRCLLHDILKELKILNLHQAIITNQNIDRREILR